MMIKEIDFTNFKKYIETLGLEVKTNTKARGNQGFFRPKRIDISKNIKPERIVPTMLHEFTHYIHYKIEPDMLKTGGTFTKIFKSENPIYEKELTRVTQFVDENSRLVKLYSLRDSVKQKLDLQETIILEEYPEFQRSKPLKRAEKIIKQTPAKHFLKYDRIYLATKFHDTGKIMSLEHLDKDFPEFSNATCAYLRFKSLKRRQSRLSAAIRKYEKYYSRPCELFARLVEGLYIDYEWVCALAPETTKIFFELLENGYYKELKEVLKIELNVFSG